MRLKIALACISASLIAFQLCLMQILSYTQWYHFAFMVISIALMGFGTAGTFLSLFRNKLLRNFDGLIPGLILGAGTLMVIAVPISQFDIFNFDSFLIFTGFNEVIKFFLTCIIYTIPFFAGSLVIGMIFVKKAGDIGTIYFYNLAGSAIGGFIIPLLLPLLLPVYLPVVAGTFAMAGGLLLIKNRPWQTVYFMTGIALITMIFFIIKPAQLNVSEFKNISKILELPESKVILERPGAKGLIQAVRSPALRYAPGLSFNYRSYVPETDGIFRNGNWLGPLIEMEQYDSLPIFSYTTKATPYILAKKDHILILDSGTGEDIVHALHEGTSRVVGVEPDRLVTSLLLNELAVQVDSVFYDQHVQIINMEAKSFIHSDTTNWDLIILPSFGVFGGNSGINALQDHYIYTTESMNRMYNMLSEHGIMSITCWMDNPPRASLRFLSTFVEMLKISNVDPLQDHIIAVRSWGTITFMIKKLPFTEHECDQVRLFCSKNAFDPALLPDISEEERSRYNQMESDHFFTLMDQIIYGNSKVPLRDYIFNIDPTTDNRPFFSHSLKLRSIKYLNKTYGTAQLPYFEIGLLILFLALAINTILALFLIILPLIKIRFSSTKKLWIVLYFSGIGLGYMFIEIVLIHRMILYFGNPVYSAAVVIGLLLLFSGLGSLTTGKKPILNRFAKWIPLAIIILIIVLIPVTSHLLVKTIAQPMVLKIIIAAITIAPLAFIMGMPFPVGIQLIHKNVASIPWAWAINSCLSVIGSIVALIIVIEAGFINAFIAACFAYFLTFLGTIKLKT